MYLCISLNPRKRLFRSAKSMQRTRLTVKTHNNAQFQYNKVICLFHFKDIARSTILFLENFPRLPKPKKVYLPNSQPTVGGRMDAKAVLRIVYSNEKALTLGRKHLQNKITIKANMCYSSTRQNNFQILVLT